MGLLYGENCIILTSNAFDSSIRATDGIAMAYTRYSIYAVVRKNTRTQTIAKLKFFND